MANNTVKIDPALQRKINKLQNPAAVLRPALEEAGAHIVDYMATAPRKAPGAFSALATPRQKRAYWARVRAGEISHGANGYIRTSHLVRSWNVKLSPDGMSATVGSNAPGNYGPFVQSAAQQQPFHRASGWRTDQMAVQTQSAAVNRIINRHVARAVE